eukprot:745675-Hanusia_phi.AAC.1
MEDGGEELIAQLEKRIEACGKRDYDAFHQLLRVYKKKSMRKQLEKIREEFSLSFPLAEDLWLEWIGDEMRLAFSEEDQRKIIALFERALSDYPTTKTWSEYVKYIQKLYFDLETAKQKAEFLSQVRDVMQRSLRVMGNDLLEGFTLWELQRNFEVKVLESMQDSSAEEKQLQISLIRECFDNEVKAQVKGLADSWVAYESWETDKGLVEKKKVLIDEAMMKASERELRDGEARRQKENSSNILELWQVSVGLIHAPFDLSDLTKECIQGECESGHVGRVICAYERALSSCCLVPTMWNAYAEFVRSQPSGSAGVTVADVYKRSVRNCPFSVELWSSLFVCSEEEGLDIEEMQVLFKKAIAEIKHYSPLQLVEVHLTCSRNHVYHPHDVYFQILLAECDCARRSFLKVPEDSRKGSKEVDVLRSTFANAVKLLEVFLLRRCLAFLT